jgi:hypothetical protein
VSSSLPAVLLGELAVLVLEHLLEKRKVSNGSKD